MPGLSTQRPQHSGGVRPVVVTGVAQHEQGGFRADGVRVAPCEHLEGMPVVAVPVEPDQIGLARDPRHHVADVAAPQKPGDLVGGVDERERPDPGELLPQRVRQQQGEVRERRHRAGDVAQDNELGLVRFVRTVVGPQRHAAGGERGPHGAAEVQPAGAPQLAASGQPGREPAGQRIDLLAQLDEITLGRPEKVDLVSQGLDRGRRHRVHPAFLGKPAPNLGGDHLLERTDPLGDRLPGDPLGEAPGCGPVEHRGQQVRDQGVR